MIMRGIQSQLHLNRAGARVGVGLLLFIVVFLSTFLSTFYLIQGVHDDDFAEAVSEISKAVVAAGSLKRVHLIDLASALRQRFLDACTIDPQASFPEPCNSNPLPMRFDAFMERIASFRGANPETTSLALIQRITSEDERDVWEEFATQQLGSAERINFTMTGEQFGVRVLTPRNTAPYYAITYSDPPWLLPLFTVTEVWATPIVTSNRTVTIPFLVLPGEVERVSGFLHYPIYLNTSLPTPTYYHDPNIAGYLSLSILFDVSFDRVLAPLLKSHLSKVWVGFTSDDLLGTLLYSRHGTMQRAPRPPPGSHRHSVTTVHFMDYDLTLEVIEVERLESRLDTAIPFLSAIGAVAVVFSIVLSATTYQRRVEERRRAAEERVALLESARENEMRIVSYIFHELGYSTMCGAGAESLNNITLATDLARDHLRPVEDSPNTNHTDVPSPSSEPDLRRLLDAVSSSSDMAVHVLNDALDLQKLVSGVKPRSVAFRVMDVVHEAVQGCEPATHAQHVKIRQAISLQLSSQIVCGDAQRLTQVLYNLLNNAIKFSPRGGRVNVTMADMVWYVGEGPTAHRPPPSAPPPLTHSPPTRRTVRGVGATHVRVRFSVRDEGPGIAPAEQERLFQPWAQFRKGAQQEAKGSGLGLAICREFVEGVYGGQIGVVSDCGQGAVFYFDVDLAVQCGGHADRGSDTMQSAIRYHPVPSRLPSRIGGQVVPTNSGTAAQRVCGGSMGSDAATHEVELPLRGVPPQPGPVPHTGNGRGHGLGEVGGGVLIVEDQVTTQELIQLSMVSLGVEPCYTCSSGREAVDFVLRRPPEAGDLALILIDREMPVMDGPTAVRELRQRGYRGRIVGLTGSAHPTERESFMAAGLDGLVPKPINREQLAELVLKT